MNRRKFFRGLAAAAICANSLVRADFVKAVLPKQIISIKTDGLSTDAHELIQQTIDYAYRKNAKVELIGQQFMLSKPLNIPFNADVQVHDCFINLEHDFVTYNRNYLFSCGGAINVTDSYEVKSNLKGIDIWAFDQKERPSLKDITIDASDEMKVGHWSQFKRIVYRDMREEN